MPSFSPKNTIVLFGGTSNERRVSVASAQNISAALPEAELWFTDARGRTFEIENDELAAHKNPFQTDFVPRGRALSESLETVLPTVGMRVMCLALHGGEGEDGTLQKQLERHRLAYTGSDAAASARAFDKRWAKRVVREVGVRTSDEFEISRGDFAKISDELQIQLEKFKDLIIKPVAGGSSIGLFRLNEPGQISTVAHALQNDANTAYLAEAFVPGKELTVGVYDNGSRVIALPPSEVRLDPNCAFDYEGKYLGRGSVEITPAEVPASVSDACQMLALKAHQTLGCFGYSRTDIIVSDSGPVFLETNTLPGLTRASFIPQQLAVAGISFREFLDRQVEIAAKRRGAL